MYSREQDIEKTVSEDQRIRGQRTEDRRQKTEDREPERSVFLSSVFSSCCPLELSSGTVL
ncbi:MAG: hypothetical protein LBD06_05465 [Candidatus Accumulibacter sp.]|nr:hypothetical protein [Accumulibacter sp.]